MEWFLIVHFKTGMNLGGFLFKNIELSFTHVVVFSRSWKKYLYLADTANVVFGNLWLPISR